MSFDMNEERIGETPKDFMGVKWRPMLVMSILFHLAVFSLILFLPESMSTTKDWEVAGMFPPAALSPSSPVTMIANLGRERPELMRGNWSIIGWWKQLWRRTGSHRDNSRADTRSCPR